MGAFRKVTVTLEISSGRPLEITAKTALALATAKQVVDPDGGEIYISTVEPHPDDDFGEE
jgi:hypothetical protein